MTNATDKTRPEPKAGYPRHRGLCAGQERGARRRRQGLQAVVQRKPARRLAGGDRGRAQGSGQARILSGRLGDPPARGDRRRSWPEPGQYRLLERLRRSDRAARPDLSRRRATRAFSPNTASSSTRSTSRRRARCRLSRKETDETADVDAILAAVTRAHEDCLPCQPEQSDRHLHAVRRGQAAACGICRSMCCWCSTLPMPNMCGATTTKSGIELVSSLRECRDDAHLLENPRAWRRAHRLGLLPGPYRRRAEPDARTVQCQCRGDRGGRRGDGRPRPCRAYGRA